MNYADICRDAFALVDDIGNGSFNTEFSERGTMATTVEVAMPVLAVFRTLDPDDPASVAEARSRLAALAGSEQGVFSPLWRSLHSAKASSFSSQRTSHRSNAVQSLWATTPYLPSRMRLRKSRSFGSTPSIMASTCRRC